MVSDLIKVVYIRLVKYAAGVLMACHLLRTFAGHA